ncbi:vitamin D3 hydroxylase-associated protein-like [Menidia menidia]
MERIVQGLRPPSLALTAAVFGGGGALLLLARTLADRRRAREQIGRARQRREDSLRRAECAVLRHKEANPSIDSARILSLSLCELTKELKEGSLSPPEVFYTYMEKTLAVHRDLNCCTEVLLESLEQLQELDSSRTGLLYGVPVSIKENVGYKDHDCSCGVLVNLECPVEVDSVLVQVLKLQGAVPFVKTNLPQALLNYDCSNPIFGQTVNPHSPQKTSGGSSGGEAALLGGGGSPLGIGSDIGGSIRIPASFCGVCGFKPTSGRLSSQGQYPIYRGQKSVLSSVGPMARDVGSLALCMRALLCPQMFSLDPTVPPLPFDLQVYEGSSPLRIGYYESDGYSEPAPGTARCIREVKALLERAGHTLVPFSPLRVEDSIPRLMIRGMFADGATSMLQKLRGSPVDPCLSSQLVMYRIPIWMKKILFYLLRPFSPRIAACIRASCGVGSVPNLWEHHAEVEDYVCETIAEWRRLRMDALICPSIGPAYNFLFCGKLTSQVSNTMIFNLLNFPAGVVPVSTVTAEDEAELEDYRGVYGDMWDKLFKEAVRGGRGLPLAVQCVSLPWRDELCLRLMREVEQLVRDSRVETNDYNSPGD